MSQEERFGSRDRTYSAWHRCMSTQRFVGIEAAQTLAMIDLDAALYVECDEDTYEPLALIETARDVGQDRKVAIATKRLAMRTSPVVPAFTLLYTVSNQPNPHAKFGEFDIERFRVRRIWPEPETVWESVTPGEWALRLVKLRQWCARKLDQHINSQRVGA